MTLFSDFRQQFKAAHQEKDYHQTLTQVMLGLAMMILLVFSLVHIVLEHYVMAVVQGGLSVLFALVYFDVFSAANKHWKEATVILGVCILFWFFLIDGGIAKTAVYWIPFFPFMILAITSLRRGLFWIALFLAGALSIELLVYWGLLQSPYSFEEMLYFFIAFSVYVVVAVLFELLRNKQQQALEEKNAKLVQTRDTLRETLETLEEEVEKRTFQLKETNRQLEQEIRKHQSTNKDLQETEQKFFQAQKMEALGTLVGGLAHDFSNVMSGISANLFVLQREVKGNDLMQEKLDEVEKLVFHASEMSRQLLTFARKDDVEKKQFDMTSFMNEALKLGAASLSSRIRIEKRLTHAPLPVCASTTQLQQVLFNLLSNAKDALSREAEPKIRVTLQLLQDAMHLRKQHPVLVGSWLYWCVEDNGQGIPPQDLVHIFEPFFTTKKAGKGTGLGLAMCYGAIQSHGGMIEAESTGKGASFHIYLPLDVADSPALQDEVGHQAWAGKGETILIADDDRALRLAHQAALEKLNYKVLLAADGREAIKLYAEHQGGIDMVMMDSMMPNMDGIQAAEHILMMDKQAKIFFATAYEKDSTTGRWLSQGSKAVQSIRRLQKPFTVEQLCRFIRQGLDA